MTLVTPELFGSVISFHGHYPKRIGKDRAQNACRKWAEALHTLLVIFADSGNHNSIHSDLHQMGRGLLQDGIRMKTD